METCDETTARVMGEALLNHAREICRYACTYSETIHSVPSKEEAHRKKFMRNVERMIKEMHALMLMAKHKGISRFCNREQIEAYIDNASRVIERPAAVANQSTSQFN